MKQAVILIHGIGEQVPMETLRGFVKAVWMTDPDAHKPPVPAQYWSKPDQVSGNFELRRLTTSQDRDERRTDFFEFYWAHLMEGTQVSHLLAWAKGLIFRRPSRVPKQLRGLWWFLVLVSIAVAAGIVLFYIYNESISRTIKTLLSALGSVLWLTVGGYIVKQVAGDAARYLHVAPPNIESRRKIREAGITLLQKLHEPGKYDRVIVCGHSLGSVIGYDLLTYYWAQCNDKFPGGLTKQPSEKLEILEGLARDSSNITDFPHKYQAAQSEYFAELKAANHPWLVTDFITMGCPLAHASMLLAKTEEDLREKQAQREFPTCPPTLEEITVANNQRIAKFTYQVDHTWIPHHAAVFAPTRWTNLFFPCRKTIWGDVVGGPTAPAFGHGIRDVAVETDLRNGLFTHTLYWTLRKPGDRSSATWIDALREAVRICTSAKPTPSAAPTPTGLQQIVTPIS